MGSLAHKGATLPLRTCLPVDKNTLFLAHYDITAEESLCGIKPDSSSVYSLRPFEGKYGGAVAVEEGTTNLLATAGGGAAQDWTKWSHWNNTTYWGLTEQYDDPVWGKVFRGTKNGSSNANTYIYDYYPYSYTNGDVYSFSCWIRVNKTMSKSFRFYLNSNASGTQHDVASVTKTIDFIEGKWQYLTFTSSAVSEDVASGYGGFGLYMGTGWDDCIVEVAYPQFEKKPFSTSFVNGTRNTGKLCYSAPLYCRTVAGWWKLNYLNNNYQRIAGMYRNVNYPHWYFIYQSGSNGNLIFRVRDGVKDDNSNAITITKAEIDTTDGNWHFFALVFDDVNNKIRVHIDNKVKKELSYSGVPTNFISQSYFDIGCNGTNELLNGLVDEIRVDKVARTADEIENWYLSQSPFFPKGIHRIYA